MKKNIRKRIEEMEIQAQNGRNNYLDRLCDCMTTKELRELLEEDITDEHFEEIINNAKQRLKSGGNTRDRPKFLKTPVIHQ